MGYPDELFTTEVFSELKCSICIFVLEDPVQLPCEHLYCRQCIIPFIEKATQFCPLDRKPAKPEDAKDAVRAVKNLINDLMVKCTQCKREMSISSYDRHLSTCCDQPSTSRSSAGNQNQFIPPLIDPITVCIVLSDGAKETFIDCNPSDTVMALKLRIQEKEGIRADSLVLILGDKPLDDTKDLTSYVIKTGSTMFTTRRFKGGVNSVYEIN